VPISWFDEIDLATEVGKKQFAAKKMNDLAMASFTMVFTREGIMRLVSKTKTKEWPMRTVIQNHHDHIPSEFICYVELADVQN
jgi:hypothetical protein